MAKFKVVTPTGPTYGAKTDYALELEALRPLGAEIVEVDAKSEEDFVRPRARPTRCTPRAAGSRRRSPTGSSAAA